MLSALRLLQGFSAAAGAVISRAVVRDIFHGEDSARFFSRLSLLTGVAPMVAPMLGGQLLLAGSWRLLFVVLALIGVANLVLVYVALPETLPRTPAAGRGTSAARFWVRCCGCSSTRGSWGRPW